MKDSLLLAIDIGTTTTKGALYALDGSVVAEASRKHTISSPKEGYAEHDAEKVWWAEVSAVIRELTSADGIAPERIEGVGISSLSPALLPVDENGYALYPAMLYGLDKRSLREIDEIKEWLKENGREDETIGPLSTGPKILWLKRNEPEVFEKARWFIGAPSFIVYRLTGEMVADYACYCIGGFPFSKEKFGWDPEMCEVCGITPDRLPRLDYGTKAGGYVTEKAAEETGLCPGTPVAVGTGDFPAECISYGNKFADTFRFSFGTTVGVNFGYNSSDPLFEDYDPKSKVPEWKLGGGSMPNGCSTIDWTIRLISGPGAPRPDNEVLAGYVESTPPGSNGIIMLPYLNGSGKPMNDPLAKGMIFGLEIRHTYADVYRASLEALAFSIRHIVQNAPPEIHDAIVIGGGTLIPGLMQIVSDVTGFTLTKLETANGSLIGAAFLAGMACGEFTCLADIDPWIKTGEVIEPNPENKEIYDKVFEKYVKLYEATADLMH